MTKAQLFSQSDARSMRAVMTQHGHKSVRIGGNCEQKIFSGLRYAVCLQGDYSRDLRGNGGVLYGGRVRCVGDRQGLRHDSDTLYRDVRLGGNYETSVG